MAKKFLAGAIKHPGALHAELGVPKGKKIPYSMLLTAAHKPGLEGKRARLALAMRGMNHSHKK